MSEEIKRYNVFHALANRIRLSEPTVRKAFSGQPITWRTATILSNALEVPIECFCVKIDGRHKNGRGLK